MAKFTFKHAVMSAGKSRELARIHYTYINKDIEQLVLVITPSTDNRMGQGVVASRSGERINSYSVAPGTMRKWITLALEGLSVLESTKERKLSVILMDEVQFFTKEDIFAIKEIACLQNDVPVVAFGLKSDFQNNMFEGAAAAITVAECVEEIETICAFCNERAIMNLRFLDGHPVHQGEQIQIGDSEYRPVCHKHYLDDSIRITQNQPNE